MRKTVTSCLFQKEKDNLFKVIFLEYKDIEIYCESLEDALNISPVYLSTYMLFNESEFVPHIAPLTPPRSRDNNSFFSLIVCDLDEMQEVLDEYSITAKEFLDWLYGNSDEILEKKAPEKQKTKRPAPDASKPDLKLVPNTEPEPFSETEQELENELPSVNTVPDEPDEAVYPEEDKKENEDSIEDFPTDKFFKDTDDADLSEFNEAFGVPEDNTPEPSDIPDIPEPEAVPVPEEAEAPSDNLRDKIEDQNKKKYKSTSVFASTEEDEINFIPREKGYQKEPISKEKPVANENKHNKNNNKNYKQKKKKKYNDNGYYKPHQDLKNNETETKKEEKNNNINNNNNFNKEPYRPHRQPPRKNKNN